MVKLKKKISIILIAVLFVSIIFNFSFAIDTGRIRDEFSTASSAGIRTEEMKNTIFTILTHACAVLLTLSTGIGFVIATPGQKAKLKEKLWLICAGVFLLVAGIPIVKAIADIFDSIGDKL